ncbi:MAG: glycosyltransferase [Candidatus Vogelbacteria bacterium]|nr:glycosyltransferase [Candidatus Vogelbacteria bacterium]
MKICYINLNTNHPRDRVTIRGLRENGVEVVEITDNSRGLKKFRAIRQKHHRLNKNYDLAIVGYTGAILVPWLRLISLRKIIYNAGNSFYESMVISRRVGTIRAFWYWLIDFVAFHAAHLVLVESEAQKTFLVKMFNLRPNKLLVHLTGVDDQEFYFDPTIEKLEQFTVVFRGKFLPEAGVEIIIMAAKELEKEKIKVRIIGQGLLEKKVESLISEFRPGNVELITNQLSFSELRQKMQECHLSLGQLAKHPRLYRTIPHKIFESLAMKLPYLTGRNKAVLEVLTENETCLCFEPGNTIDLAQKISQLKNHPETLARVAQNSSILYHQELTAKHLGAKLLTNLR